jgi:hypothetical protein
MKDRKLQKRILGVIIKGRSDMLPHAKNMVERKCENIRENKCPFCNKEEGSEHIIIECEKYEEIRERTREKVYEMMRKKIGGIGTVEGLRKMIPLWFSKDKIEIVEWSPYKKLRDYDKLAGALGYIPKLVRERIREAFGRKRMAVKDKKDKKERTSKIGNIMKKINYIVMKGTQKIWKEWNRRSK